MRLFIVLTLVFSIYAIAGSKAPDEDPIPSWQQSESINIQLGVRDFNGSSETYEAVFMVESKENVMVFEVKIKVLKDNWGFVYFPDDFPPGAKDGKYDWKCLVNSNIVSSGSFTFSDSQRNLILPKK